MTPNELAERLRAVAEHIAVLSDTKHEKADALRDSPLDKLAKALTAEAAGLDAVAEELSDIAAELDGLSDKTTGADD